MYPLYMWFSHEPSVIACWLKWSIFRDNLLDLILEATSQKGSTFQGRTLSSISS